MADTYSISELAAEYELTPRAIRFYEDRGLLAPTRRGQTRVYDARDRARLRLIQRGKRLGFSLDEISQIINLYETKSGEAGQLRYFLERIDERRGRLLQQRDDIEETLADLANIEAQCRARLTRLSPESTRVQARASTNGSKR